MGISIRQILRACDGSFFGEEALLDSEITSFVKDSREIVPGCAYLAITGERADGHDFIKTSFEKGAYLCIGEKAYETGQGEAYIMTDSSVEALGKIASSYMAELDIPIVGITGSVGKTGTKEMIASVLASSLKVSKTIGNHNNEIGLPLTCLETPKDAKVSVLEMGISAEDEMDYLTGIVQPKVAVLTNIGVSHMEILGSKQGIYNEKIKIAKALPGDGLLVINGDDEFLATVDNKDIDTAADIIRFGFESTNDYYAADIRSDGLLGSSFTIYGIKSAPGGLKAALKLPGRHLILNALAAAAVGDYFGISPENIASGLLNAGTIAGRMNIIKANDITIIDDSYNASPVSMKAAIEALSEVPGRKICVLGDMFELGDESKQMHYDVGRFAAKKGVSVLFVCGEKSVDIAKGALGVNIDADLESCVQDEYIEVMMTDPDALVVPQFYIYKDNEEMIKKIREVLKPGDTVLIKASNSMRFYEVAEALKQ